MSKEKAILGLILIIVGVSLLFHQLNLVPDFIPYFIFRWPMILIIFGAIHILTKPNKIPGLTLMIVGGLFLMGEINHNFRPMHWWPIFLILAGLGILFRKKREHNPNCTDLPFNRCSKSSSENAIEEVAIFGGGERIIATNDFCGGKVTAIFGGSEINLLHSTLAPGKNEIEVFAAFGGVTFIVPQDWKVRLEVTALFGALSDQRVISQSNLASSDRELVIKGTVIFGGGEIKNR